MKTKLIIFILFLNFSIDSRMIVADTLPTFCFTINNVRTTDPGNPVRDSILLFDLYMYHTNFGQPGVDPFEFAGCQLSIFYNKGIHPAGKSLFFSFNTPVNSNTDLPPALRFPSFQIDSTYSESGPSVGLLKANGPIISSAENFFIQQYPGTKIGTMRVRTTANKFNPVPPNLRFKLNEPFKTIVNYFKPYSSSDDSESTPQSLVVLNDTVSNLYLTGYLPAIRILAHLLTEGKYSGSPKLNSKDSVTANLRNGSAPFNIVESSTVILDSVTGEAQFIFPNSPSGNYHTEIRHLQCIAIWSAAPEDHVRDEAGLGGSYITFISSAPQLIYGSNLKHLGGNNYGMYSGDVNQDDHIDLIDVLIINNDAAGFMAGKVVSDLNGDRIVDLSDIIMAYNNSVDFVNVIQP
jgi:hypothetical protein